MVDEATHVWIVAPTPVADASSAEPLGDSVHQNAATGVKIVTKRPAKGGCTLYLKTEEWQSG